MELAKEEIRGHNPNEGMFDETIAYMNFMRREKINRAIEEARNKLNAKLGIDIVFLKSNKYSKMSATEVQNAR